MSEAPEDLRKKAFQEVRDLDEKISGEEMELLEMKAGIGGNTERKEECRSGGSERYSYCCDWRHSDGGGWASKLRNRG